MALHFAPVSKTRHGRPPIIQYMPSDWHLKYRMSLAQPAPCPSKATILSGITAEYCQPVLLYSPD